MKTLDDVLRYFDTVHMKRATAALLAQSRRSPDAAPFPPRELRERFRVSHRLYDCRPAFFLTPARPVMRILYFHGGAYYNEFAPAHWALMGRLCESLHAEVVAPDYPLTPVFGHREVFSMAAQVYEDCLRDVPGGCLALAGDSAGGGLALALTQWAMQEGKRLPDRLALLSPWLDITMSDPAIEELDRRDPFLEPESGRVIARWYCQGEDPRFYQNSPLFGPLEGLPPTLVFTGTRDILNADARGLLRRTQACGADCTLWEEEGMIHTWMLFPIAEAQAALKKLEEFLQIPR